MFNRILLYLLIRYISPCVVFSADLALISLDKEEHLNDVKYIISTHFIHSLEDSLMAETSSGKSAFLHGSLRKTSK